MDSYTPVIIIEGLLVFGVVLLLYYLHIREMRQIRAKKAQFEREEALRQAQPLASDPGSVESTKPPSEKASATTS
jgi:predicted lipid-binding transport protein (Tim44 family)